MTERFAQILRMYGEPVLLFHDAQQIEVQAFIQRIRRKDPEPPIKESPLGAEDLRRWLYIGPREQAIQEGDIIQRGDMRDMVQNAAAAYVGGELSHWWAILCKEREALV